MPLIYQAQFPNLMNFRVIEPKIPMYTQPFPQFMALTPLAGGVFELKGDFHSPITAGSVLSNPHPPPANKSYERRNVYKSIARHMNSYFKENVKEVMSMLKKNGFNEDEIEEAYQFVEKMSEKEKRKGMPKRSKTIINLILVSKNIYVYILKETLEYMIKRWTIEKGRKVLQKNIEVYKEVCLKYYYKCLELLSQNDIGSNHIF